MGKSSTGVRTSDFPVPAKHKELGYGPTVRVGTVLPFGYVESEDDPEILIPVPYELELYEQAVQFIKTGRYSYDKVAAWLSDNTGRYISPQGLYDRIKREKKRRHKFEGYKRYARKFAAAARKAAKTEEKFLGKRLPKKDETICPCCEQPIYPGSSDNSET